jgi:hypothetical protein
MDPFPEQNITAGFPVHKIHSTCPDNIFQIGADAGGQPVKYSIV